MTKCWNKITNVEFFSLKSSFVLYFSPKTSVYFKDNEDLDLNVCLLPSRASKLFILNDGVLHKSVSRPTKRIVLQWEEITKHFTVLQVNYNLIQNSLTLVVKMVHVLIQFKQQNGGKFITKNIWQKSIKD